MEKILMPARASWRTTRGVQTAVEIPVSHAQLEKAVLRTYPLLDNHLAWLSLTLPGMTQHLEKVDGAPGSIYAAAVDLRNRAEAKLAEIERRAAALREHTPRSDGQAASERVLVGVRKTPLATRVVAVYAVLDGVMVDLSASWIDGDLCDDDYAAGRRAVIQLVDILAAEISKIFRAGLDVSNEFRALKEVALAAG